MAIGTRGQMCGRLSSMKKFHRFRAKKIGLPPGALVHVGEVMSDHSEFSMLRYSTAEIVEKGAKNLAELDMHRGERDTLWMNLYGLHDPAKLAEFGRTFNLHPLVLEDILNTDQRPKVDSYEGYLYFVGRFFRYDQATMTISSEQVSIILGRNFVLTFQERKTGSFDPVRERLWADKGIA